MQLDTSNYRLKLIGGYIATYSVSIVLYVSSDSIFSIVFWREDKSQLAKLVEAVKTNFNDRADEVCNLLRLIVNFSCCFIAVDCAYSALKSQVFYASCYQE